MFASLAINAAGASGSLLQLGKQSIAVLVTVAYSFGATLLILRLADGTVGLRVSEEDEEAGLDLSQHREVGYTFAERVAFPAHLVTIPGSASTLWVTDEVRDPALD